MMLPNYGSSYDRKLGTMFRETLYRFSSPLELGFPRSPVKDVSVPLRRENLSLVLMWLMTRG